MANLQSLLSNRGCGANKQEDMLNAAIQQTGLARPAGELEEILFALQEAVDRLDSLSRATEGIISTPKVKVDDVDVAQYLQEAPMIIGVRLASVVERMNIIADLIDRTNEDICDKVGNLKLY